MLVILSLLIIVFYKVIQKGKLYYSAFAHDSPIDKSLCQRNDKSSSSDSDFSDTTKAKKKEKSDK
jgi:hypothetical protein